MDEEAKLTLEKRIDSWAELFKKYEERGKYNTTDCSFFEVNHTHFIKPKIKKSTRRKCKTKKNHIYDSNIIYDSFEETQQSLNEIDISNIIDGDADTTWIKSVKKPTIIVNNNLEKRNTDNIFNMHTKESTPLVKSKEIENYKDKTDRCGTFSKSSVEDLIHFIEVDLNSNLKEVLNNRSESKILEADDYSYWHECTKEEMRRLQKYITKTELKQYMIYYNKDAASNFNVLNDIIVNQMKSKIKELLIKRELVRNNKDKYLKYCQKICDEWQNLLKDLNVECIIVYASGVINSIKRSNSESIRINSM